MSSKKMKRWTEESSSGMHSASSSDDMSLEETRHSRRPSSESRRTTSRKKEDKVITMMLSELHKEMRKQSKQLAGSKDETCEMRKLLKKLTESHNDQTKKLENLNESLNGLCKQMELHTNGKTTDDSVASRSQLNQAQPPRYRLVFISGEIDRVEKGKTVEISVALVDGNNGQTVNNGPLASATVELVVVNAEFNQHDNEYNWSRQDFERNIIKRPRHGNSAPGDVDQPVNSIVSNGRFNLVSGAKCHSGSTIFYNSANKKVRFGVMVVSPMEARVLEGLSNPFFVRGHDRPARQNSIRHKSSNTQRQALVDIIGYQEQTGPISNMQNPSWPTPTAAGGMRLNTTGGQPQLPFVEYTTVPSSGLITTGGQPQLSFLGNTTMPSTSSSTSLDDQHVSMQQYHIKRWPIFSQATNKQTGMQFNTSQLALPVHLVCDRPNVEPSKHQWDLLENLMPLYKFDRCSLPKHLMQDHFGSLTVKPKEVVQTRWKNAFIEPLEADDSDEESLKRKLHNKYQFQFVNKMCKAYYTWDQIKADDGSLVKIALYDENNTKITSGPLSSVSVEVVALQGDFNVNGGQDYWTPEEFNESIVCPPPGDEASSVSVLGGDRILVLADGEACLNDVFFQTTTICAKSGMFKMGVMLASAQNVRVQEGISEPFRVIDNRAKELHTKDGPTQGFNPAAATVQFPRNTVTEATQHQSSIPHQISHLKTRSAPCMSILPAAKRMAAMASLGVLEARRTTTAQKKQQLPQPIKVVPTSRARSPVIRRAYTRHSKLHLAPMFVPSIPSCSFLQSCSHCQRELTVGMDIYMYRGDRAFCSDSCRCRHMMEDDSSAIDSCWTMAPKRFHRSGSCYKATPSVFFFLEGRQVQG